MKGNKCVDDKCDTSVGLLQPWNTFNPIEGKTLKINGDVHESVYPKISPLTALLRISIHIKWQYSFSSFSFNEDGQNRNGMNKEHRCY